MKRNFYCGEVKKKNIDMNVVVSGWVHSLRDHGNLIFIDLRDKSGFLQIVFQNLDSIIFKNVKKIGLEFVITVEGIVKMRPKNTIKNYIDNGDIELIANDFEILNYCTDLPIKISDYVETSEELRLKYRYLDLRRPSFQKNFFIRHNIAKEIRDFFNKNSFIEIETPFLTKSTYEGARDFLIPSRLHHGSFFALPQSPQLFKQILMIAGFDKYYQFAKCFRDEDLRADRQLEFTQIDVEMSFVDENDVMCIVEKMLKKIFKTLLNINLKIPFNRLSYCDAILQYGSDKPDTRFDMKIYDFSNEFKNSNFNIFSNTICKGGVVRGICIKKKDNSSFLKINKIAKFVDKYGTKNLTYMYVNDSGIDSNVIKFFKKIEIETILSKFNAKSGDLLIFIADKKEIVSRSLGLLRVKIANELKLIDDNDFNFLWIVDFPLFKWDDLKNKWESLHHPFTSPKDEYNICNCENICNIKSKAYDIILNGVELGGGSIRIHKSEIQKKVFEILNIPDKIVNDKFGFLLDAFNHGAPPHGGFAIGFDRLCALIIDKTISIRDVIAFPKTQKSFDPLFGSPSTVENDDLKELGLL
ncbi:MAG: aspartate--tRNA ligase [Endomicrobium sp.]|nr:aspartate--tRNA ligase [Endomicrobium sp.]